MKTARFGFGSLDGDTHLDVKRSVLKNALAMVCPAFLCLFVIACAILQPYSADAQFTVPTYAADATDAAGYNDTCVFGDLACIARQSQTQVAQADFLARQYPLILKNAQTLESNREALRGQPTPEVKSRLAEMTMRVHIMTILYNAHASRTDPALLSAHHLPTQLAP